MSELGARLRRIRAARTQPEMAASLGIAARTYANYERGVREPDARVLAALAGQGWDVNWILTGSATQSSSGADSGVGETASSYAAGCRMRTQTALALAARVHEDRDAGDPATPLPAGHAETVLLALDLLAEGMDEAQALRLLRSARRLRGT